MASVPLIYRKLTGVSRGLGLMTQLWLGPDHLLQVQSTGYTESYQRFYLRDIQALLVVHGDHRLYVGLILGGLGSVAALIAWYADASWPAWAVIGVLSGSLLLWNHLLGAGCRVVLVTAVQKERLSSLARLPKTRRVLAELKPLIEAAQADLVAPAARVASAVLAAAPVEPPLLAAATRREPPALPPPLPPVS